MLKVLVNALFLDDYGFPKCINRTMYTYPLVPYHLKASRTYLVGDIFLISHYICLGGQGKQIHLNV